MAARLYGVRRFDGGWLDYLVQDPSEKREFLGSLLAEGGQRPRRSGLPPNCPAHGFKIPSTATINSRAMPARPN